MFLFALSFTTGVWLLQQQASLPAFTWLIIPATLSPALLLPRASVSESAVRTVALVIIAGTLGFFYASFVAQQRMRDALPVEWQGRDIELTGVIAELPRQRDGGLSFAFDVEIVHTPDAQVPQHILLATYNNSKEPPLLVRAGERWRLVVRLKRPHGASNPHGFDFEARMLERGLRAGGYVRSSEINQRLDERVPSPAYLIERARENVRERFVELLGDAPHVGVLVALAIGDQDSIPADQWQLFTRTGVNHLMSISGLHITMLASFAFFVTYALWRRSARLTARWPARKVAAVAGFAVALAYALLSGFSVPAQRTVYMLTVVALALWSSRNIAISQIFSAALMVVLLLDPWAVLSPGFWLSFGAVGLIFYATAHRLKKAHWLIEYGRTQWAMIVGPIPPLLALFQQISLVAPLANAFAIPLISFAVVPLALLGILPFFGWSLTISHALMSVCVTALEWLNRLPEATWNQHAPPAWTIAVGVTGTLICLLPRGFPARWLGIFLLLPMFLLRPEPPPPGALRLTIFDVGQGLAVSAQTHTHTLLFDTGPFYSADANSGNRILVPGLRAQGTPRLDGLILSHDDADHTGGAISVMQGIPVGWVLSSLPEASPILAQAQRPIRCGDGQHWEWDGVRFEILHPSFESYANPKISDNNRGCVLRMDVGQESVLIAADIEKNAEQRLLQLHPDKLHATLLIVPHHGSKTSSTPPFVAAVHPLYAVITAGYRNRFGHPRAEVVARYRQIGSELFRSDEDGAVMLEVDTAGMRLERVRKTQRRYWYED
jgi:competence protein ComEC